MSVVSPPRVFGIKPADIRWLPSVFAVGLTLATLGLRLSIQGLLGDNPTLVVFTIPIILSGYFGGLLPGLVSTITSLGAAAYYLLPPIRNFAVNDPVSIWQLVIVALAGGLISVICGRLHRSRRQAETIIGELQVKEAALEVALKESEELRTALDDHAIVAITDAQGKITFVNDKFCAISKYPREELLGRDHRLINSGYHSKAFIRDLWQTIAYGRPWHGEIKNRAKDGSFYWVATTIVPFLDDGRKPRQYIAIRADITERKQAERLLTTQHAVSRVLADAVSLDDATPRLLQALGEAEAWDFGAIWVVDPEAGVLRCAEVWHRPGLEAEALTAKTRALTFVRGAGRPGEVWAAGESRFVPELIHDAGHLRAELAAIQGLRSALAFPILQGSEVVGVVDFIGADIRAPDAALLGTFATIGRQIGGFLERRRAEAEVRRLNSELEHRVADRTAQLENANQELEAFSYSVSHDLRAPLRTVDGFAQAVLEDYGSLLPEDGKRDLTTIRAGAQQMGRLIDDLLTFSRLSRAPLAQEEIHTGRLVREAVASLESSQAGRRVDLRIGDLPPCRADPALLRQVWLNLLSNAFKYTGRREMAVIEVGCRRDAEGPAIYFVRDNGTGFDMRYAHKLFGVFQRLHRMEDYEGTGVGLAIVQRVVHRHGGRVWAEAVPDQGATFFFTLNETTSP